MEKNRHGRKHHNWNDSKNQNNNKNRNSNGNQNSDISSHSKTNSKFHFVSHENIEAQQKRDKAIQELKAREISVLFATKELRIWPVPCRTKILEILFISNV